MKTETVTKKSTRSKKTVTAFSKMTAADKRVAIAKDVILQIKNEKFKPIQGDYGNFTERLDDYDPKTPFKDILTSKSCPACEVCAKGAVMLSVIRKDNKMKLEDAVDSSFYDSINFLSMNRTNDRFFSTEQMETIEGAYEGFSGYEDWIRSYPVNNDRLVAIMKNIIRNKGDFVYDDLK